MNTRRTFFKKIMIAGIILPVPCISFTKDSEFKMTLKTFVTRDVLIPYPDGTFDFNTYGEYLCFTGEAMTCHTKDIKVMKFQSEPILFKDFTINMWNKFEKKCEEYFRENAMSKGSKINNLSPKIIL